MTKRSVMICDDQKRFIDEFIARHGDYYDVEGIEDTRGLFAALEKRRELPDILLLDLYHPFDVSPSFDERRQAAEASLTALDEQIDRTKQAVLRTWEPHGLDMLEELRRKYPASTLPIAIFTQKGLLLLDDEQLRKCEQLEGHWLLKKKLSARTEEIRIDRIIEYYEIRKQISGRQVFIIHGHDSDNLARLRTILINRYHLEPVILKEMAGLGETIIRKLEAAAENVVFAIALLTPDDFVKTKDTQYEQEQARPNVLFEIGYFYGLLKRNKVCILSRVGTAIPSDLGGVSIIQFHEYIDEIVDQLDKELTAAHLLGS